MFGTPSLIRLFATLVFWAFLTLPSVAATKYAAIVGSLLDPVKLATLGPRGANPRVQKVVYWLAVAQKDGQMPKAVLDQALVGKMSGEAANLTKQALLRNLSIAERLGCLDAEGLTEMRKGSAATIRHGPYKGDQLSVDHIIPRSVVPELDNVIANVELMPLRMDSGKRDRVGARQVDLARKLHEASMLSIQGRRAVDSAALGRH